MKIRKRLRAAIYGWKHGEEMFLDPLTKVYDRRLLEDFWLKEVARAKRYNRSISLVILDIDDLKVINDIKGHKAGDVALQILASSLLRRVRGTDIVIRFGGDEFLLILPETNLLETLTLLGRLQKNISVSFSFGVAEWEGAGGSLCSVIEQADKRLYLDKLNKLDKKQRQI